MCNSNTNQRPVNSYVLHNNDDYRSTNDEVVLSPSSLAASCWLFAAKAAGTIATNTNMATSKLIICFLISNPPQYILMKTNVCILYLLHRNHLQFSFYYYYWWYQNTRADQSPRFCSKMEKICNKTGFIHNNMSPNTGLPASGDISERMIAAYSHHICKLTISQSLL